MQNWFNIIVLSSSFSATKLLGTPAEVYLMGAIIWWMAATFIISALISTHFYLPIFHELEIISTNDVS